MIASACKALRIKVGAGRGRFLFETHWEIKRAVDTSVIRLTQAGLAIQLFGAKMIES